MGVEFERKILRKMDELTEALRDIAAALRKGS